MNTDILDHLTTAQELLESYVVGMTGTLDLTKIVRASEHIGLARLGLAMPDKHSGRLELRSAHPTVTRAITKDGTSIDCAIINLSAGGLMLDTSTTSNIAAGELLSVDVPWLGRFVSCRIKYAADRHIHAQFEAVTTAEKSILEKAVEHDFTRR